MRRGVLAIALAAIGACGTHEDAAPHDASTPVTDAPATDAPPSGGGYPAVECEAPLGLACNVGPENLPCEPTWAADACTPSAGWCNGMLGLATANSGFNPGGEACVYDAVTLDLIAYVQLAADGPDCVLGRPGLVVPVECVQAWNAAPRTGCLSYGQPKPWYCEALPGSDDQGEACTSSAECNYDGGLCLFGPLYDSTCAGPGACSTAAAFQAGCPTSQVTGCACDGGPTTVCNDLAVEPFLGECTTAPFDAASP